ncbi:TetR/AcrR family transcriptional regulator [Pseudodesulfovibrio sp. zrk46]|uniref:TetR/AcrR family transcriptional regulator n=1 Tax=Pseudodesulfovibrio sp. zrk46 TaxID=2725288 RepID=UPI001448AE72|nr:TetR/AcrR family transcriptional regulator [Pseudodesulfovibrio sp. zrk46]QJB57537.1 TetR/AcrR family transcriptional regulator [Pseudodesulfovibrio sp. zrk46]
MSDGSTRARILNASSDVFCQKGFENTTIRDICTAANANVAAVNYHFGDKKKLYNEVLKKWMMEFAEEKQLRKEIEEQKDAEGKIRVFIKSDMASLCAFNDPSGIHLQRTRILLRELSSEDHDPDVFECYKDLEEDLLHPVIRDIVGPVDDKAFEQACIVANAATTHHFIINIHDPRTRLQTKEDLEYMTDFLTSFVMGGLKAIRENYNDK